MQVTSQLCKYLISVVLLISSVQTCLANPDPPPKAPTKFEGGYEVEEEVELGFGFRAVTLLIPTSWEVGHFGFLYYRDQQICHVGSCAVSPSGEYVVFQDVPSAQVFVYRRIDGRRAQLTIQPVPNVKDFVWHEETGTVDWHYGTESRSFREAMEQESSLKLQSP